ncbi:hypothetical protein [Streptomyces sp. NPDC050704]|uniref:hypothetical protein n=1 Tax=Streptomyces sp. NPDC050704 TaxID=3157219 RepID=UPI00341B4DB8
MIFEAIEAMEYVAHALAVWLVIGAAILTAVGWAAAWAARAAWRRLTGARSAVDATEAPRCPQCAPGALETPYSESGYQEAA